MRNYADCRLKQGEHAEAKTLAERALAIQEKALAEDHPDLAETHETLAEIHIGLGDEAKAEEFAKRAGAIRAKAEKE